MSRVVFGGKNSGETKNLVFDFAGRLAIGESVSSATTVATVYSGTDSTPSAVINGAATCSGTKATQSVKAGTVGVTYLLTCTAVTSASQTLVLTGFLAVLPGQA